MDEHLIDVGARALADARGDAEPTGGDRLLAEIVINATTFERPSPLHDFVCDWFVKHLGDKWKGYAHALACDIIEDGFTNEGNRR